MSQPMTAAELREAQEREYGQYVAKGPIDIGGARAFNTGDPVPSSHVQREVVRPDQVAKKSTKAGQAAVEASDTTKG